MHTCLLGLAAATTEELRTSSQIPPVQRAARRECWGVGMLAGEEERCLSRTEAPQLLELMPSHNRQQQNSERQMTEGANGGWRVKRCRNCRAGAIHSSTGMSKDAGVGSSYFFPHTPVQCVEHFGTDCCHLTRDERREQKPAQLMPRELLSRVTWVGRALSCPAPEPGDKQKRPSQFTTCPARRVV